MTQIELLNKIKQEVERRSHGEQGFNSEDAEYGYRSCARDLLSFLDTLQEENNGPIKARVKESGKIVEGFLDGKGHFDVPVDHDIFNRYDIDELVFAPLQVPKVDLEKEIEDYLLLWVRTTKQ